MNHNKLITEELRAITALMSYDRSKTLMEQPESVIDRRLGITRRNADALGMDVRDYEKAVFSGGKIDPHILLPILSIGALFIPVVGPALSLGLELADAAFYLQEGDKEMAGLSLAFTIIPFGELVRQIPAVKGQTVKWLTQAIKKGKQGKSLSKLEQQAVIEVATNKKTIEGLSKKHARLLKRDLLKNAFKASGSIKDKIGLMYKISKTYRGSGLLNLGLQIGGIFYTYDKLFEIYGYEEPNFLEDKLSDEEKSQEQEKIEKSWNVLDDNELNEKALEYFEKLTEEEQQEILDQI